MSVIPSYPQGGTDDVVTLCLSATRKITTTERVGWVTQEVYHKKSSTLGSRDTLPRPYTYDRP